MNELRLHPNEINSEDRTKKCLKKMKVTLYTNKVHLLFRWLNHRNSMDKLLEGLVLVYGDSLHS